MLNPGFKFDIDFDQVSVYLSTSPLLDPIALQGKGVNAIRMPGRTAWLGASLSLISL